MIDDRCYVLLITHLILIGLREKSGRRVYPSRRERSSTVIPEKLVCFGRPLSDPDFVGIPNSGNTPIPNRFHHGISLAVISD